VELFRVLLSKKMKTENKSAFENNEQLKENNLIADHWKLIKVYRQIMKLTQNELFANLIRIEDE
jgi:hypothetical protein